MMIEEAAVNNVSATKPDLSASIVTVQDGKNIWEDYFSVSAIKAGYFKGEDINGQTVIVQTLDAKLEQEVRQATGKKLPDLYIYLETLEEGEKVWTEILVAWQGKKQGYFTGKNSDGNSVVIQTRAVKESYLKQLPLKRVTPVDLGEII